MKKNENKYTDRVDLAVTEEQLRLAIDEAYKLVERLENSSNEKIIKDLDIIIRRVKFIRGTMELAYESMPIVGGGIEEWKDLVIQSLPDGASVAMANDVEAALENIKSVY